MTTTPPAATALAVRHPKKRTPVRVLMVLLAATLLSTAALVLPGRAAHAVPVSERTASWIAMTSRQVALELRSARDLPASEARHVAGRQIDELAGLIAHLLNFDPAALRRVWADAPLQRKVAMFSALSQVGVPYRVNADAPFVALDCSALTKFAWAQAGVDIERGSVYQYAYATKVARDAVQMGDFVWYPGHIMLSLGVPELIVHARSGNRAVEIHRIDSTRMSWMRWASPIG